MKQDITTIPVLHASATMESCTMDDLKKGGNTHRTFRFIIGDVVGIPTQLQPYKDTFTLGKGDNQRTLEYYLLKVMVRNEVRAISMATWRKDSTGIDDFVQNYHNQCPIARELSTCNNDAERALYLAGKTLKVVGFFEGRAYKFISNTKVEYRKDDESTYDKVMWPIFEDITEA